ncbi:ribosome maturation factor RimM [Azospirillum sp. RWY-5-1]|uniref:Ribosome maturation factor RimM n=1 Tax=Azospirillum oleiclasticum TaxID=2735135 RepID=A0ABX2T8J3_9PROT|nr:ribosome maturation factor RimM [Azospirillum oleiclasticum]NYZ13493.1 ribosome maturation factor RimM [Azospirillum oleiclasticum]NYZ20654.1 ribosome maturation factor RimM [Azospirillum oleiclasticum]
MSSTRVCVGQFAGAHGVRGQVKLRSFTGDPEAVVSYGPLSDEEGRRSFRVSLTGTAKDAFLARVEGVATREAAEALTGLRLYVDRAALPDTGDADEFYHADLIGLRAELSDGTAFGTVKAVFDFGAGDMLEIRTAAGTLDLLPFTRACVPLVDVRGGRIVVSPPETVEVKPEGSRGPGDEVEDGAEDQP